MSNAEKKGIVTDEIAALAEKLGIILDDTQLNIGGERDILSPHKYVLMGSYKNSGERAVLKCARHPEGVAEITQEHKIMQALRSLPFSEEELIAPRETFFGMVGAYTASITDYIPQDKVFTDFSLEEQFFMAVHALESQETFHATTREHQGWLRSLFVRHTPHFYIKDYGHMQNNIHAVWPDATNTLKKGAEFLSENHSLLEAFDRHLIHFDLVPHNFRIKDRQLYLLDFVSFRLGNKYESWARFVNFMEVHSPKLVPYLLEYVKADRGDSEYLVLRLMRVYKAVFLLNYYAESHKKTEGALRELTGERLKLWTHIVDSILNDTPVDSTILGTYYEKRAALRTPEEKARQRQFTWAK